MWGLAVAEIMTDSAGHWYHRLTQNQHAVPNSSCPAPLRLKGTPQMEAEHRMNEAAAESAGVKTRDLPSTICCSFTASSTRLGTGPRGLSSRLWKLFGAGPRRTRHRLPTRRSRPRWLVSGRRTRLFSSLWMPATSPLESVCSPPRSATR
jgi:hypothetical protein